MLGQQAARRSRTSTRRVGDVRGARPVLGGRAGEGPRQADPFNTQQDKLAGKPLVVDQVTAKMMTLGVSCLGWVSHLVIAPPLIITEAELDEGLRALDEALAVADAAISADHAGLEREGGGSGEVQHADGRVELDDAATAALAESPLYNHDLAPVRVADRTWTTYNYAALWISMAHCIPTYMLAAGLIAAGMSWRQALFTICLGNIIVLVPILANSHAGTKYGIPFPVLRARRLRHRAAPTCRR